MDTENDSKQDSLAKTLFFGEIDEDQVFPFPEWTPDQKEMGTTIIDSVRKFATDKINSRHLDETSVVPPELVQGLAELGLCGLAVPEEYGGLGLDYCLYARVFGEIAAFDGSIGTLLGAHQSIGYRALINEGNPEQKKKWLPRLASGEILASFCLTEPGSGSDAYSIKTKAVQNKDGTYTINGQKLWITNAGSAFFYSVFAKTEHIVQGEKREKISCFIVEKDRPGVSFGEKENKMGIRASETRAVFFENVTIPAENVLGELGQGFKIAMNVLNTGRLSLGAGCVEGMRRALKMATGHAKDRKQFGQSIAEFGLIQDKLATMAANVYSAEAVVFMTTGKMVQGMSDFSTESAICKVYCSEIQWDTLDMALQIAGGTGYMKEYPYEQMMRDARILKIYEGTNEILRCLIALSGIKAPSDNMKELGKIADVSKVLNDPIKSLGVLSDFAKKRIGKMMGSKVLTKVHPDLEKYGETFSALLSDFAIAVENTLLKYGKNIIGNELPQKRLADMAIDLYMMICVLSRTTQLLNKPDFPGNEKEYIKGLTSLIFKDAKHRFIGNLKGMKSNNDKTIQKVSQFICENGGHTLDVLRT